MPKTLQKVVDSPNQSLTSAQSNQKRTLISNLSLAAASFAATFVTDKSTAQENLIYPDYSYFPVATSTFENASLPSSTIISPTNTSYSRTYGRVFQDKEPWATKLAKEVIDSNVQIVVRRETQPSNGSGTLIIPPKDFALRVLHPDEVLIASASHIVDDWNENCEIYVNFFTDFDKNLNPKKYVTFPEARVINRYYLNSHNKPVIDIALIAVVVPKQYREKVNSLLRPLAPKNVYYKDGAKAVAVGCPGEKYNNQVAEEIGEANRFSKSLVRNPVWLPGQIMYSNPKTIRTRRYGTVQSREYRTASNASEGHSGGGLFNKKAELIAIISAARRVKSGTVDFRTKTADNIIAIPYEADASKYPSDSILIRVNNPEEISRKIQEKETELGKKEYPNFCKSTGRTTLQSVQDLHLLIEHTVAEWDNLQVKIKELKKSYFELKHLIRTSNLPKESKLILQARLQALAEEANTGKVQSRLNELKPKK